MKGLIVGILTGDVAVLVCGSFRVFGVVAALLGLGSMMKMGMGVLIGSIQSWVIVPFDILLRRRVLWGSFAFCHVGVVWYRHGMVQGSISRRWEDRYTQL